MDARLQRTVVDYEDAQSWPLGSKERNDLLDKAIAAFEIVYKDYRSQLAGLSARMLQGKCYEEKGELGPAMGIYNELFAQPMNDPIYNEMRRRIGFFRIIVDNKRKEYALAVDEAARWLQDNPRYLSSESGLGVQLELARALKAQLDELNEKDQKEAARKALARLDEVVRYFSPYKAEALVLRKEIRDKFKIGGDVDDRQIAAMTYDEAMAQADSAMSTHEWDRAIKLFQQAIKRADPAREPAKANKARYFLAYCEYSAQRYYSAAAICDHLVRRYPQDEWSLKAVDIGIAALTMAYNTYVEIDRTSDLDRLIDLASFAAETWSDKDQGDAARVTLGEIYFGRQEYVRAAKSYEGVRAESPRRLDAQMMAGEALWRLAQKLREEDKGSEAEAQGKAALDLESSALEARKKAGAPATDPALVRNSTDVAEILRATGKPKEALALLEPLEKTLAGASQSAELAPLYEALVTILLKAHLGDGQTDRAIADLKTLEKAGSTKEKLTGLYYDLTMRLKEDMEAQKARNDAVGYKKTRESFKKFLTALATSQSGQTYQSLLFAGSAMIEMGMGAEAVPVFDSMLTRFGKDPEFLKDPKAATSLAYLKYKKAVALREANKFEDALALDKELLTASPRDLTLMMEKGFLYEDWARAERSLERWNVAFAYWKERVADLSRYRTKPLEYYDSVYHMAIAQTGQGRRAEAVTSLERVMKLSPSVGKPEMKAKYVGLLKELGK